ncbi:MAG TPA: hypothetical protein VHE14_06275 [Solirubrobacteraceae bacterium]|nr:hypothetical protein [Solirubrobacteraceae bacterium]
MRDLIRLGSSALTLLLIMFLGSLVLWIGVPLAWLWIGSQIEGATRSLGAAIGAMIFGVIGSIAAMVVLLARLSNVYRRSRVARGLDDTGNFALETVLVLSAGVAVVGFTVWFFIFAGTSPIPINLSY